MVGRSKLGTIVTAIALVTAVACGKSYGEDNPTPPDTTPLGTTASSSGKPGGSSTSSGGSTGTTSSSGTTPDAGDDASSGTGTGPACPSCAGSCFGAGCSGLKPSTCAAPVDLTKGKYTLELCPMADEGILCFFPGGGGGAPEQKKRPVGVFRVGANSSVTVTGVNPAITTGSCDVITGCGGGSQSTQPRDVAAGSTFLVGTTDEINKCVEITIIVQN